MIRALILAGGEGKRIGGDKPLKLLLGYPLIDWALKPYLALNLPITISLNNPSQESKIKPYLEKFKRYEGDLDIVFDQAEFSKAGPLSGLYAAFKNYPKDTIFLVSAVDQPLISPEIIIYLQNLASYFCSYAIVFKREETLEPLPGAYPASLSKELEEYLQESSKKTFRRFLSFLLKKNTLVSSIFWHKIDSIGRFFLNINTNKDLKELERCFYQIVAEKGL